MIEGPTEEQPAEEPITKNPTILRPTLKQLPTEIWIIVAQTGARAWNRVVRALPALSKHPFYEAALLENKKRWLYRKYCHCENSNRPPRHGCRDYVPDGGQAVLGLADPGDPIFVSRGLLPGATDDAEIIAPTMEIPYSRYLMSCKNRLSEKLGLPTASNYSPTWTSGDACFIRPTKKYIPAFQAAMWNRPQCCLTLNMSGDKLNNYGDLPALEIIRPSNITYLYYEGGRMTGMVSCYENATAVGLSVRPDKKIFYKEHKGVTKQYEWASDEEPPDVMKKVCKRIAYSADLIEKTLEKRAAEITASVKKGRDVWPAAGEMRRVVMYCISMTDTAVSSLTTA